VRRGGIYDIDFDPARGSEEGKTRPALVVQNDVGNRHSPTTIVVAITSQIPSKRYPFHVALPASLLGMPGTILCEQMLTVDKRRVLSAARADIDTETQQRVDEALRHSLGLSSAR
jgi:mRNA interferase MazF